MGALSDFVWPTLANFNDKLTFSDGGINTTTTHLNDDVVLTYTGPPPAVPDAIVPTCIIPPIPSLIVSIIASTNKLFFIAHKFGIAGDYHKRQLVGVSFTDSIAAYPSCLQDCHFLVDFYIMHPADVRYNAITNQ